jgi:hypothetical protein
VYDYVFILQLSCSFLRHEWSLSFTKNLHLILAHLATDREVYRQGQPPRWQRSNISTGSWCLVTSNRRLIPEIEHSDLEVIGDRLPKNWPLLNDCRIRYSAIATYAESVEPDSQADGNQHGCAKSQELRISPSPFSAHEAFIFGEARRAAGQVIHDVPGFNITRGLPSDDLQCLSWRATSSLGVREAGAENAGCSREKSGFQPGRKLLRG